MNNDIQPELLFGFQDTLSPKEKAGSQCEKEQCVFAD